MRDALTISPPRVKISDHRIGIEATKLRRGAHSPIGQIGDMPGGILWRRTFFFARAITIIIIIWIMIMVVIFRDRRFRAS